MEKLDATVEFGSTDAIAGSQAQDSTVLALMIAWAPAEPDRIGEVALFDASDGALILGRGEPDRGSSERVVFLRQRPGFNERRPALTSPGVSREQLRIQVHRDKLRIERIGKCGLEFAGELADQCVIGPGESILLRGQLMLYCTRRPRQFEPAPSLPLEITHTFGGPDLYGIVGESPAVWRLREQLAAIGKVDAHTLLIGPSGSGKETCARAIHALSARSRGPFVLCNSVATPGETIDGMLFGNAKNYPNPGMTERSGLIRTAEHGTLFLDEMSDMPASLLVSLSRVLDNGGEYRNLGGTTPKRSDFRLIGATNQNPESLQGELAARFVMRLDVPGLDQRRDDIPLLARHLLRKAMDKNPGAVSRFFALQNGSAEPNLRTNFIEKLLQHSYTTNIRELGALLWRAMSSTSGSRIDWPRDLPLTGVNALQRISDETLGGVDVSVMAPPEKEPSEMEMRAALAESQGNVVRAAKKLGLPNRYVFNRLMRKYGIESA